MTLFGAVGVVFSRRIIYSALSLIVSLFGVAALYVLLYAPFLAAVQVLLYVGGIAVLMLFGVVVAQQASGRLLMNTNRQNGWALLVVTAIVIVMGRILTSVKWPEAGLEGKSMFSPQVSQVWPMIRGQELLMRPGMNAKIIGGALSETYVMPFMIASIILLVAMIGAVLFVRRDSDEEEQGKP